MSAVASSTAVTITGTPESWLEPPRLYERTLTNVQAIVRPLFPFSRIESESPD